MIVLVISVVSLLIVTLNLLKMKKVEEKTPVTSVNYHFLRACNYSCKFCFHTYTNDDILPFEQIKVGLDMLANRGMKKMNFAGGEPFLAPKLLGQMVKYCKEDLHLDSVSIVSNGSKITEKWLKQYGEYVDIIALSCDSFDDEINKTLGRGKGTHIKSMKEAASFIKKYGIKFKLNSVICSLNWEENMKTHITELEPFRWKVFQVLPITGENKGEKAKRNVTDLLISSEQFEAFKKRHSSVSCMVPEDNSLMQNSYLLLDENMCFLNCTSGAKVPSKSILAVGVDEALIEAGFNTKEFEERGGLYADQWTRDQSSVVDASGCGDCPGGELPEHLQF